MIFFMIPSFLSNIEMSLQVLQSAPPLSRTDHVLETLQSFGVVFNRKKWIYDSNETDPLLLAKTKSKYTCVRNDDGQILAVTSQNILPKPPSDIFTIGLPRLQILASAQLSLFRVVTLEDWTDIMYIQMFGSDVFAIDNPAEVPVNPQAQPILGAAYFVSFVLLGTMVMLNLFIGVVIGSMQEAQAEAQLQISPGRRQRIAEELDELTRRLHAVRGRIASENLD
jgi:hypothetical protein